MKKKIIISIVAHHFLAMLLLVIFTGFNLAKNIYDPLSETIGFLYHPYYWFIAYGYPIICSSIFLRIFILSFVIATCIWAVVKKTKLSFIFFNIGLFFLFSFPIIIYWITGILRYCGE